MLEAAQVSILQEVSESYEPGVAISLCEAVRGDFVPRRWRVATTASAMLHFLPVHEHDARQAPLVPVYMAAPFAKGASVVTPLKGKGLSFARLRAPATVLRQPWCT